MISSAYGSAHHSSFWEYHDHSKIRRGSPRTRALNEGGVGTNWRFSTNKPPSPKLCEIRQRLLLITNRKSNTRFRLVPKSTTLVDPEMTLDGNYALRWITNMCFGANHQNLHEDRPMLSAAKMYSPVILVSNKLRFMRIFAGVCWRGGVTWKWAIFASFARYILLTFTSKATFIILYNVAH